MKGMKQHDTISLSLSERYVNHLFGNCRKIQKEEDADLLPPVLLQQQQ